MSWELPALVVAAYLVGATPTSYWVAKAFHGIDLRTVGSGNLGATNVYRVLGWRWAVPVMIADMLKGWAPVAFFPRLIATSGATSPEDAWLWGLLFGGAAVVGHVFSFWVGFRGGKGVATSAGAFFGLAPVAASIAFAVWVVTVLVTRYVSLASLIAAVVLSASVLLLPHPGGAALQAFTVALSVFVIWAHRANIRRLLRGEENRIGTGGGKG